MCMDIFSGYGPDKLRKSLGYSLVFNSLPLFRGSPNYKCSKGTSVHRKNTDKNTAKQIDRQNDRQANN